MEYDYKCVSVYADDQQNLILIPTGECEAYGGAIMGINLPRTINYPYTDEFLAKELKLAMDDCYTLSPTDIKSNSPILSVTNKKSYEQAVKGKKSLNFEWNIDDGYYFTPLQKSKGKGYDFLYDKTIILGKSIQDKELVEAFKEALLLCIA